MAVDFDQIRQELGSIRYRARSLESASVKSLELVDASRQIVAMVDRVARLIEDAEREFKRAKRAARDD